MNESPATRAGVLISAAVICFCAGGLYGWSALIPVIENRFGTSTEQSGLVFSTAIVAFSIAVIVSPRLPAKYNGLDGCIAFGVYGAVCLILATIAPNFPLFLISFGLGFGACSGVIYINALAICPTCGFNTTDGCKFWHGWRSLWITVASFGAAGPGCSGANATGGFVVGRLCSWLPG